MFQSRTNINDKRIILQIDGNYNINELDPEKYCLKELNKLLSVAARTLGKSKEEFEREMFEEMHKSKELEQEKILLSDMNESFAKRVKQLEKCRQEVETKLRDKSKTFRELEQEKMILSNMIDSESDNTHTIHKKYYITIALAAVVLAVVTSYSVYVVEYVEQSYTVENLGQIKSSYLIENLRGDTIDTWLSWRLVKDDILHIIIVNSDKYPEKVEIIKNTIQSTESIEIDDSLLHKGPPGVTSTYYLGWKGALEEASGTSTKFFIPKNLEVLESNRGEGDIIITLTDQKSGDGYSGFTKSIADETQNQILKSQITIYEISQLTDNQLSTIVRHELGHAFGLAHSTAPEDLMYPTIETEYPYISECDIDAITSLYDGNGLSQVVCEK